MAADVDKNIWRLWEALYDYRMTVIVLSFKEEKVDDEIWELYHQIKTVIPYLKKETFKRPLILRKRGQLRTFSQSWQVLINKQNTLMDLISKAPSALVFYDKMQIFHLREEVEKARRAENELKIVAALEELEKSLSEIQETYLQSEPVVIGSEILRLDDPQKSWEKKLSDIREAKSVNIPNVDEVLNNIYGLQEVIREVPTAARWIRGLERKLSQLVSSHDLLLSLGRSVIPQTEMARITLMMYEQVPKLWTSGDLNAVGRILQGVEKFISYYENSVQMELEVAERRRPGITRSLSIAPEPGKNGLTSLTLMARSLVNAVDSRDPFMRGHSEEVARIALQTGRKLNLSTADLEYLELAALLHDVGKLSIPETILSKVSPLTTEERKIIEKHPYYGAKIVKEVPQLNNIIPGVYHHQERWDGQGYPDRLSKKDIPLVASIIALSEAFTVMTTNMPYREAMPEEEALKAVQQQAEKQFDPQVVEAFMDVHQEKP